MAFFHLHLANMSFPSETEIVSTNKIINISKNVGTSHFSNIRSIKSSVAGKKTIKKEKQMQIPGGMPGAHV